MKMIEKITGFRKRLKDGPAVVGPILDFDGWQILRRLRDLEYFDFLWIDLEHGVLLPDGAYKAIDTLNSMNMLPLVRAAGTTEEDIKRAADLGPAGIVLPHIDDAEQAEKAIERCLYPPEGSRSLGPNFAANQWMIPNGDYVKGLYNKHVLIIAQIESVQAVENIDEICSAERIDVIFVGRFDLSASLGYPAEVEHPAVIEAEQQVLRKAKAAGKSVGTIATQPELFFRSMEQGFDFILTTSLMNFMAFGVRDFFKS